jgi:hypothetical protein
VYAWVQGGGRIWRGSAIWLDESVVDGRGKRLAMRLLVEVIWKELVAVLGADGGGCAAGLDGQSSWNTH